MAICLCSTKMNASAVTFPSISVEFDPSDQSVIVSDLPAYDASETIQYELNGYLNYGSERRVPSAL